jgi:hypothetical protein
MKGTKLKVNKSFVTSHKGGIETTANVTYGEEMCGKSVTYYSNVPLESPSLWV